MGKKLKINSNRAKVAMTEYLLGNPGGLIPLYSKDPSIYVNYSIDDELYINFNGRVLTVFIITIVSTIEDRSLWLFTSLINIE